MDPLDIHFAIRRKGHTYASIARELNVTVPAVWGAVQGHYKSLRVQTAICRITGIPFDKMWPAKKLRIKRVA